MDPAALRRVAKNGAVPMATTLFNRALDLGLAFIMFRELGPSDVGRYTWLVLVVGYFDILINFGLGILLTRDLARDPAATGRHVGSAAALRLALWALTLGMALIGAGPLMTTLAVTTEMGVALVALTVGIGISNLSGLIAAVFNARERMEYPAFVSMLTASLKLTLGATVLLLGFGIIGLAVVSVMVNIATGVALLFLARRSLGPLKIQVDLRFGASLITASYALMLNNLLATVFFRIDGLLLRNIAGDEQLGWYSAAYRFIDGLSLIPSSLTLALFPILARLAAAHALGASSSGTVTSLSSAEGARDITPETSAPILSENPLLRPTRHALKLLLSAALPIAVGTTLLAEPIMRLIAGDKFLPHGTIALQVLIWFVPFSFANGLLQYVLISLDRQRVVTGALVAAVTFNVVGNLIAIPSWGYLGAATITVLSEVVLLGPFLLTTQRHIGRISVLALAWRSAVATSVMGIALAGGTAATGPHLAWIPLGAAVYCAVLLLIGGLTPEERAIVARTLRWKKAGADETPAE